MEIQTFWQKTTFRFDSYSTFHFFKLQLCAGSNVHVVHYTIIESQDLFTKTLLNSNIFSFLFSNFPITQQNIDVCTFSRWFRKMDRDIFCLEKHYWFPLFFEKLLFTCQKETKNYVMVWFHAHGQSIISDISLEYLLSLTSAYFQNGEYSKTLLSWRHYSNSQQWWWYWILSSQISYEVWNKTAHHEVYDKSTV